MPDQASWAEREWQRALWVTCEPLYLEHTEDIRDGYKRPREHFRGLCLLTASVEHHALLCWNYSSITVPLACRRGLHAPLVACEPV